MPRIGICGSAGTGKIILSRALSSLLTAPMIKEEVREWLKRWIYNSPGSLNQHESKVMQTELLAQKIDQETSTPSFIADRTTIDNMAYALYWHGRVDGIDDWLSDYIVKCIEHANKAYNIILVLPWGVVPPEDDGVRSQKPFYQYTIQMLIEGIISNHPEIHSKTRIIRAWSVEDRIEEVMNYLN